MNATDHPDQPGSAPMTNADFDQFLDTIVDQLDKLGLKADVTASLTNKTATFTLLPGRAHPTDQRPVVAESELISEMDAAKQLRMSRAWLAKEARAGNMPYIRLGNRRWYTQELIARIIADSAVAPSDVSVSARNRVAGRRLPPRRRLG